MTIGHDRAVARKMVKLRMFDIASNIQRIARTVLADLAEGSDVDPDDAERLKNACDEWLDYVEQTRKELGIDVEG